MEDVAQRANMSRREANSHEVITFSYMKQTVEPHGLVAVRNRFHFGSL